MIELEELLRTQIISDANEHAQVFAQTLRVAFSTGGIFTVIHDAVGYRKPAFENAGIAKEVSREGPISDEGKSYIKVRYQLTQMGQEIVKKDIYGDKTPQKP